MLWRIIGFVVVGGLVVWLASVLIGVVLKLLGWLLILGVVGFGTYLLWRVLRGRARRSRPPA